MCGVSGFFGTFSQNLLKDMNAAQIHRGPDGAGVWHDPKTGAGLAHRRLSIIDLSGNASQPMQACGGRYIVSFNGEIYNFKALEKEVHSKGYKIKGGSDTAVLGPLYDLYGAKMLDKLSGIFAFAIYDREQAQMFIARDHLGIKPLYYTQQDKGVLFSSEIKGLLAYPQLKREVNTNALLDYLTYLWSPGAATLLQGVQKLLPGHYLKLDVTNIHKQMQPQQWYQPPLPALNKRNKPQYDYVKSATGLLSLFDEVVTNQSVADVDVAAFLSGGVDSSAIVASMVHTGNAPKETFCMAFSGDKMADEGFSEDVVYARKVAKHLGVHLNEVEVNETCLEQLPEMIEWLEEPQADPAPLYVNRISRAAQNMDIKVLMAGTGGDDIFSGYRRHQAAMLRSQLGCFGRSLASPLFSAASYISLKSHSQRRFSKLSALLKGNNDRFILNSFAFIPHKNAFKLLSLKTQQSICKSSKNALEYSLAQSKNQHLLNRVLYSELHGFLPDHNLNYTDKAGMAASVEIRVPFLDPELINFAHNLPIKQKSRGLTAKYMLKKAMEPRLPKEVLYRSKAGFGAPMRKWLQGPLKPMVNDLLSAKRINERGIFNPDAIEKLVQGLDDARQDVTYTVFSLMCIELWMQRFIDK